MQVAAGVFQFKVPMSANPNVSDSRLGYTLVYAIETPAGWVVVDAGVDTDHGFEAFQKQLSEAGIAPRDVSVIVITHGHNDHVGLASRIKELTGARLVMHRLDATNPFVLTFQPGALAPNVDLLLEGTGELVPNSGLWALWTPGHTPGHLCVHDQRRRLLFSGDHVLPAITPNVSLFPGDPGNPLERFLESQRGLKTLDVQTVHPAHQHSFSHLGQRVDVIIDHHRKRMNEMLAQVKDAPKTSWQIASSITWHTAPWEQLDPRTRQTALWETMAHLKYLVSEGELMRQESGSAALLEELGHIVSLERDQPVALVGVGRLGRATLNNPSSGPQRFKIVAAFDADPRQVGQVVGGLAVQPMDRLREVLRASDIRTAIVAVPGPYAQGVIDRLVECDIAAIVNYAPIAARVPPHVKLRNVDAVLALQSMTLYLRPSHGIGPQKPAPTVKPARGRTSSTHPG